MAGRLLGLFLVVVVSLCLLVHLSDAQSKKKMGKSKSPKRRVAAIVKDLEQNVSALWDEVEKLSQPVHVHIHGDGRMMDQHDQSHDDHDHQDHDHDQDHHDHGGGGNATRVHNDDGAQDNRHGHRDHGQGHSGHKRGHHGHEDHGHGHRDHKHGPKDHKYGHKDHKHKHDGKMKKKGHGHDDHGMQTLGHSHTHEDDDDEMHHGHHGGTHVHIHFHTGMDEDGQEQRQHAPPPPQEYRYARCDVTGNSALPPASRQNIRGTIFFRQMPEEDLQVEIDLQGFTIDHRAERQHKHLRGMHGHMFGDMSNGCSSQGGHFNPHGVDHGGPEDHGRHPGDFGNLQLEEDGTVVTSFKDSQASLFGPDSLLGRGMVIHAGPDDHGKGGDAGSKSSGNAGARIACCAIVACGEPTGIWAD